MFCRINLAGPPRGKGRGRAVATPAGTRVYTDAKTRSYEAQLRFAGQQAMAGREPSAMPIQITMIVAFAIPMSWSAGKRGQALAGLLRPTIRPDADNSLKLCDALNGVVWVDDKQIVTAVVAKIYSDRTGLTIEVWELRHSVAARSPLASDRETDLALL